MSPPEMSDSSTSCSGGTRSSGQSYSARSSTYAPSHISDYESYASTSGVDVAEMLSDRMNSAFDPIRMDKSLPSKHRRECHVSAPLYILIGADNTVA